MEKINYNNITFYELKDFDGYYISKCGKVYSKKTKKIMSPYSTKKGYLQLGLCLKKKQKYFLVHRLVGETFIPNIQKKSQINHINGIKDDNRLENLEWCTNQENHWHMRNLKKFNYHKKKVIMMDSQNNTLKIFNGVRQASRATNISHSSIINCCKGKIKHTQNFIWSYSS